MEVDRIIHEPARLRILTILSGVDLADFTFLCTMLGLTKGNLSSHMDRLEKAGYIEVEKSFNGRIPHTEYRLTKVGRRELSEYWARLDAIRSLRQTPDDAAASSPGESGGNAMGLELSSSAFQFGETIPTKYTGDGPDVSPPLHWGEPPGDVESFALISDDPDAPVGTWVHWVVYDIPADVRELPEAVPTEEEPEEAP